MKLKVEDFWKGYFLVFERPFLAKHNIRIGQRLLIAFAFVALIAMPILKYGFYNTLLGGHEWSGLLLVCLYWIVFHLVYHFYLKTPYSTIGLSKWSSWTWREKLYLLQVAGIISVVFSVIFQEHLSQLINNYGWIKFTLFSVLTAILWGIVQEFIYRGLLQTEFVRRFGAVSGILLTNIVFTFGPLHSNYFHFGTSSPIQWTMFLCIFGIGLLFGILYHRSGNLWIPAIFHGLWPLNMS